MTYYTRYRMTGQKDIIGNDYTVEILQNTGTQPAITEIEMGAPPVEIQYTVKDQDVYDPIRLVTHDIQVKKTDTITFEAIKRTDNLDEFVIKTTKSPHVISTYLDNRDYSESHGANPKILRLTGYEGFDILKLEPFSDLNGNRISGKTRITDVIRYCLGKLPNIGSTFKIVNNLYHLNMTPLVCPLYQTYIDAESLYEDGIPITSFDAFKRIMESFGMTYFEHQGNIWLVRTAELYSDTIRYYDIVVSSGGQITTNTINPRVTLTGNAVSRTARIDWINNNAELSIIPAKKYINVKAIGIVKDTFWEYSYFKEFEASLPPSYIPVGWNTYKRAGIPRSITNKASNEGYSYNGETYYPVVIYDEFAFSIASEGMSITEYAANVEKVPGLYTDYINLHEELRTPGAYIIKITITFRIDYNNQTTSDVKADFNHRVQMTIGSQTYEYNPEAATLQNTTLTGNKYYKTLWGVTPTSFGEYRTDVIQFYVDTNIGTSATLRYWVKQLITNQAGTNPDLIIKNVKMEMLYADNVSNTVDIFEAPESSEFYTGNAKGKGEAYEREVYYHDCGLGYRTGFNRNYAKNLVRRNMYWNILYYYYNGDYQYTYQWDYNSKGLNRTVQEVLLYDLTHQYSTKCHVLNGDLMGAGLSPLMVIIDSKDESRMFIPLTVSHDLKKSVMSGEFMELKTSVQDENNYLADEELEAILDDEGNEIFVNF